MFFPPRPWYWNLTPTPFPREHPVDWLNLALETTTFCCWFRGGGCSDAKCPVPTQIWSALQWPEARLFLGKGHVTSLSHLLWLCCGVSQLPPTASPIIRRDACKHLWTSLERFLYHLLVLPDSQNTYQEPGNSCLDTSGEWTLAGDFTLPHLSNEQLDVSFTGSCGNWRRYHMQSAHFCDWHLISAQYILIAAWWRLWWWEAGQLVVTYLRNRHWSSEKF